MDKVHVSEGSGKLSGILSINTNPLTNSFCHGASQNTDQTKNWICKKCYSIKMLTSFRKNCVPRFEENSRLLSSGVLPHDALPAFFPGVLVRLHSHGELINGVHVRNFFAICRKSPGAFFSLFTKRPGLVKAHDEPIPENVTLVYSNLKIDQPRIRREDLPPPFHKVFNVMTHERGPAVNCFMKCIDCGTCFERTGPWCVVEKLK